MSLAALLVLLAACSVDGTCRGHQQPSAGRIVGGENATIEEFPWLVAVEFGYMDIQVCGGSVISDVWVLTAAHCFDYTEHNDDYHIRTSTSRRKTGGLKHEIKTKILHDGYYHHDDKTDFDIAVVQVTRPFVWTEQLKPVPGLATVNPEAGAEVRVYGWGQVCNVDNKPIFVRKVTLKIQDWEECKKQIEPAVPGLVTERVICAYEPQKGICMGDSGGPLVLNDTGVQVGLVVHYIRECPDEFATLYTSVAYMREWIKEKTGI